jgi:tetratricopeptide (TPR) repeat protein
MSHSALCRPRLVLPVLLFTCALLLPAAAVPAKDAPPSATVAGRARIAADPTDPAGWIAVAQEALKSGDGAAALKVLREGRAQARPSAPLLVLLGAACLDQNKLADAEQATQDALTLDPAVPGGDIQLGAIFERVGWPESAVECYARALARTPADNAARCAMAHGLVAAGRAAQAEKECVGWLGTAMKEPSLLVALAQALEAQDQLRPAFNIYGRVIMVDPLNAEAHARRGRLYCRFAQFDEAATECRVALKIDPRNALAHACLGLAYQRQGQNDAAREQFLQAEAGGLHVDSDWGKLAQ